MPAIIPNQCLRQHVGNVRRFLKSLCIAGIAVLSFTAVAAELVIHTVSAHFRANADQNNYNFGLAYRADKPCLESERFKNSIVVGIFHNTYYRPSVYAGCYFPLVEYRMIELGAMAGLVTGYDKAVMPSGLLIGTYYINSMWSLKFSLAPVTRGTATLSVGYRF